MILNRRQTLSRYPNFSGCSSRSSRGLALILVIFVVALASTIVVNLAYNTMISARSNAMTVKGLQAEYILKSAVNVARVLIKNDDTKEDAGDDLWAKFKNGVEIPVQLLGIDIPNIKVWLEIRPEESKLPLRSLLPTLGGKPDLRWRGILSRLFKSLGFDEDQEKDHTGIFRDRVFTSDELVAALIDYMDRDQDSYNSGDFASGIEGDASIPKGRFPNTRVRSIGELSLIPGFTPARLRKLLPFITTFGNSRININIAPRQVIKSLHEDIDDSQIDQIIEFRESEEGPFTPQNRKTELSNIIGEETYNDISSIVSVESRWFQILAKVDYETSSFFMRAFIYENDVGELPVIRSVELFG
ncbi:MAG: type II secretion system minor pseudopilin GspK [Bdellovibrionales bacterium]|nr:type II secretion system minor pseudopilin GspK [Bdellovibrionales bacterium]